MCANNDHRQTWPPFSPEQVAKMRELGIHFDEDAAAEEFVRSQQREANSFATGLVDLVNMSSEDRGKVIDAANARFDFQTRSILGQVRPEEMFPLDTFCAGGNGGGDCDYLGRPVVDGLWYVAATLPDESAICVSSIGFDREEQAHNFMVTAVDILKARAEREWNERDQ